MVGHGRKWLDIARNDWILLGTAGCVWLDMAGNDLKQVERVGIVWKWLEMA